MYYGGWDLVDMAIGAHSQLLNEVEQLGGVLLGSDNRFNRHFRRSAVLPCVCWVKLSGTVSQNEGRTASMQLPGITLGIHSPVSERAAPGEKLGGSLRVLR